MAKDRSVKKALSLKKSRTEQPAIGTSAARKTGGHRRAIPDCSPGSGSYQDPSQVIWFLD